MAYVRTPSGFTINVDEGEEYASVNIDNVLDEIPVAWDGLSYWGYYIQWGDLSPTNDFYSTYCATIATSTGLGETFAMPIGNYYGVAMFGYTSEEDCNTHTGGTIGSWLEYVDDETIIFEVIEEGPIPPPISTVENGRLISSSCVSSGTGTDCEYTYATTTPLTVESMGIMTICFFMIISFWILFVLSFFKK